MAADSRLTSNFSYGNGATDRFTLTDNAQKLVLVRKSTIGISFCGDAIIEGKTVADILRIFDIEKISVEDTVSQVSEKLQVFLQSSYGTYNIAFIVAGYDSDEPFVYSVTKNELRRTNFENGQLVYTMTFNGEMETINKLFNGIATNFSLMPLKDAADLAEFSAEVTIKYQRFQHTIATCGGAIDLLVITKDYAKFIKHKLLAP